MRGLHNGRHMIPPDFDFDALTLKDALDLTVRIEEQARDRYVELAGQLRIHQSADAAAFFERMAREEERHRDQLARRRHRLFADAPVTVDAAQLVETEATHFDDARVKVTLQEALREALKAEGQAQAFFEALLLRVTSVEVGQLFAELRDEEVEHRRLVLAEMSASARPAPGLRSDARAPPRR